MTLQTLSQWGNSNTILALWGRVLNRGSFFYLLHSFPLITAVKSYYNAAKWRWVILIKILVINFINSTSASFLSAISRNHYTALTPSSYSILIFLTRLFWEDVSHILWYFVFFIAIISLRNIAIITRLIHRLDIFVDGVYDLVSIILNTYLGRL